MLNLLKIFSEREHERDLKEAFRMGKESGFEQGVNHAFRQRFLDTGDLTPEEQKYLTEYLVNNDIERCYDLMQGGMRARKRNFGWKEQGYKYTMEYYEKINSKKS